MPDPLLTTDELCAYLGKPRSWLYHEAENVGLRRYKIGKHYRYKLSDVENWLEERASSVVA